MAEVQRVVLLFGAIASQESPKFSGENLSFPMAVCFLSITQMFSQTNQRSSSTVAGKEVSADLLEGWGKKKKRA